MDAYDTIKVKLWSGLEKLFFSYQFSADEWCEKEGCQ
jgi:hypothetical protein